MARSENQGLQIALILFVLLTVALAIATFGFFQSADKAQRIALQATADATKDKQALSLAVADMRILKTLMGFPEGDAMNIVQEGVTADFKLYSDTFSDNRTNYRDALTELVRVLAEANQERQQERAELDAMQVAIKKLETDNEAALKSLRDQLATATTQLTVREATLAAADAEHNQKRTELQAEIQQKADLLAQVQKETEAQVKALNERIVSMKNDFEVIHGELDAATATSFEGSDGEIQWVSPRAGTVWINIGRGDSLPKQTTFSVWGRDENDVALTSPKAKIEVTQILDEHLAEARIVDDNVADPIMPGDKIFSPAWDPGRKQSFAVAGGVDFNGDGRSDMDTLRALIQLNGGEIVAELDAEGNIVGPGITIHTRYLIQGEAPEEAGAGLENYTKMIALADDQGVELIDVYKFLDFMGWKDPNQVLTFGQGGNAQETLDPNAATRRRSSGNTSELFRRRRPATNGNSSF